GTGLRDCRPGIHGAREGRDPDEYADRSAAGDERAARRVRVTSRPLDAGYEHLLRELAPQVLGAVIRRFRDFAPAEDAVQEALLAAALQWPREGIPENPRAWLIQVAARRMTDRLRSDQARRLREAFAAMQLPAEAQPAVEPGAETDGDDTL